MIPSNRLRLGSVALSLFALTAVAAELPATTPVDAIPTVDVVEGDRVSVFGRPILIPANTRLLGDVVSIGGRVEIAGEVEGNVVVVLGDLDISGRVEHDVTAFRSETRVYGAAVGGEIVAVLGSLSLENSQVSGQVVTVLNDFARDNVSLGVPPIDIGSWLPSVWRVLFYFRLACRVAVFVLLILFVALVPDRVRRIGEEARRRYLTAFFVGLLAYLGWAVVFSILSLTVLAIPLAILVFWILKWLGIAGLFFWVGQGLGRLFGREFSVLGAVLVTFALHTVLALLPSAFGLAGFAVIFLLGLAFFLLVEVPALGLVVLTRVGSAPAGAVVRGRPDTDLIVPPGGGGMGSP